MARWLATGKPQNLARRMRLLPQTIDGQSATIPPRRREIATGRPRAAQGEIRVLNVSPETHQVLGLGIAVLALLIYAVPVRRNIIGGIVVLFLVVVVFVVAPVLDSRRENMLAAERVFMVAVNPAIIAMVALAILGRAARETGLIARLFHPTHGREGNAARRMTRLFMAAIVGAFVPAASTVAGYAASIEPHSEEAHGDSVWPTALAALAGGAVLLLTSGPLLIVAGTLWTLGRKPLGPLDLTLPAFGALGAVLLVLFLREVTVKGAPAPTADSHRRPADDDVLARVGIGPNARYLTATLQGERISALPDLQVRARIRGEAIHTPPFHQDDIDAGDILIVGGTAPFIGMLAEDANLTVDYIQRTDSTGVDGKVAPLVVPIGSNLIGRTVTELALTPRFDLLPLDVGRSGRWFAAKAPMVPLEANDIVLVHGESNAVDRARTALDIVPATPPTLGTDTQRGTVAAIIVTAFALCAADAVGMAAALGGAAALAILARTVAVRDALRDLDGAQIVAAVAALAVALVLLDTAALDAVVPRAVALAPKLAAWQWLGLAAAAGALLSALSHPYVAASIGTCCALAVCQRAGVEPGPYVGAFALGCACRFSAARFEPALGLGAAFGHPSPAARWVIGLAATILATAAAAGTLAGLAVALKS
ncbi:MAG: TrkA C-terminal domain-containing protein [Alphaproteobacteria bacterium]